MHEEKDRKRDVMRAEREITGSALKEFNGEHARNVIKLVVEHSASCSTAFTNNTRYYAFVHV